MCPYHPPQRAVGAFILSLGRWMRATFHLSKLHAFDEHLAHGRTFFSLTNVSLGTGAPLEFLALRVSAAHLVVPEGADRELHLQAAPEARGRDVSCYLEHVAVHGSLALLPGIRTSDFLAHQEGFILLRNCRLVPPLPGRPEPLPIVFVNARAIVAVAEEGGRAGDLTRAASVDAAEPVG
jgi:hypothetical protein